MVLFLMFASVVLVGATHSSGDNVSQRFSTWRLSPEDYAFINNLPKPRGAGNLPGFKYIYIDASGTKSHNYDPSKQQIQIAGSPRTSWEGVNAAADIIVKMTRYMPSPIFDNLVLKTSVGVFTAAEKLTIYPEYYNLANTHCGSSCAGQCDITCTFDGRKYEDIAGVGGQRAVVLEDNILCTPSDPYGGSENILAHEFTHTIHIHGISAMDQSDVYLAYLAAKSRQTWALSSYAMSNEQEYFAMAATVYLGVNDIQDNAGGMNVCSPGALCSGEMASRQHLHQMDTPLYNMLTYVFTNNRSQLLSGLTVCPPSRSIIG
ncbi:uncharacterized protein LOC106064291 [Biomphalaria glabrata]|uniref:Uncharacterized protein LOC106064291 n=1 Tax=Biomphalaria glabrata TaxID=6526 RepID=A0A9U8E906_BIOGL|nr:uncharacterized protein LOC106064291 [Biomphalaria glabrata]